MGGDQSFKSKCNSHVNMQLIINDFLECDI